MKKILVALLLTLVMSPMFAKGQQEEVVDLSAPVTLTIWTHEDPNRKVMEQEFIDEFCKENPNVTVDYQTYPSSKMAELLTVAFSANEGPDIFNSNQSVIRKFVVEGQASELDPAWLGFSSLDDITAQYLPDSLNPVKFEGGLYGLPLEYTNFCTYVNKKIFKEAGLDPEKDYPKTWEEVMSVSEKLVQRDGEIITRRGFDFRYPSYLMQMLPMVEQLGGKLISDDGKTAVIGDEAWLRVLNYMKEWGPTGKNLGGPTYVAARKAFDNDDNEIAMSDSGLYQQGRMKSANPDFYNSGEWMVIPYPQWSDAKEHIAGHIAGHFYLVNGNISSVKQQWAWKLVNFMLSHDEDYLTNVSLVHPKYELFESQTFKDIPYSDVFKEDMEHATISYYDEYSSAIEDKMKTAFEKVMLQGEDPEKVLVEFRADVQEILDQE
ncbi:MAG: ABC transporter substrate-binding protein [Pleomorphochaeta sp.]